MTKKEIAELFVYSFHTNIKEVITSGELKGCGGNAEQRKRGEVIFGNYVSYGKREFSSEKRCSPRIPMRIVLRTAPRGRIFSLMRWRTGSWYLCATRRFRVG